MSLDDYAVEWRDLQSRITAFLVVWIGGFIVAGATIAGISSSYGETAANVVGIPLFVVWATAFFVTGSRWTNFRCPRCGEHFFRKPFVTNQVSSKCLHCGLPKWSTGE